MPSGPAPPPGPAPPVSVDNERASPVAVGFLAAIFASGFVYVTGTMIVRYATGKRGVDLAPHPLFWRDLPYLVRDGCKFCVSLVQQALCKGNNSDGYTTV